MTITIDKRIVEMAFQNGDFERNAQTSMSTIDKLKRALNFKGAADSLTGISSAARGVNLGPLSDSISNISGRLSTMGIIGITALANITNAAISAGTRLAKALTIDPIRTGLTEYETKLNSVQTILANTQKEGTNLKTVTDALNQLNEYADKTIYNFQQMTRNVGTFTAAGVKLDTSVAAIKGIANLAAISGSNAEQASTAMYQLSQALSSGTVKLMDWNSVVNAGMGGQVFQEAIKETARLHGVAIDQMIEEEGSFRETLQKGWFTSEILTETLAKFTGDLNADQLRTMGYTEDQIASIIKMGQTANDAATKVKTFTQLFDTLKEAAQSGWAQTWEILIGDFEEAKLFLTDLNNWFGAILGAQADARNELLQGWKDLGGRTDLITAFQNALEGIVSVVKPITEAMREIFPPVTSEQLFALTEGIKKLSENFKIGADTAEKVKRIFKGVFAVLDIGKMFVQALITEVIKLVTSFSDAGATIFDTAANFGDWLVELRNSIRESGIFITLFENIGKVVRPILSGVLALFAAITGGFKSLKSPDTSSLNNFLDALGKKLEALGAIGSLISKIIKFVGTLASKLAPVLAKIGSKLGELIGSIFDAMTRGLENLDINKILDILNKGLVGGVLISLKSFVDSSKSVIGGGLFAGILLSVKSFIDNGGSILKNAAGILDGVKDSLEAYQKTLKANALLKIAGAIGILALSIIALTFIDQEKLILATTAIGSMFAGLVLAFNVFDKSSINPGKLAAISLSLIALSSALLILSGAVLILGHMDPKEAIQGVLAVGSVLGLLLLFQKFAGASASVFTATVALAGLAVSMLAMSVAIRSLGGIDTQQLIQGLLAMTAVLAIVSVALSTMQAGIGGAAALLVAAGAILVLAVSLKAMSALSLEEIGIGLLALAGVLTVLGIAGAVLTPVIPTLLLLAAAMLAIGLASLAFGAGILIAATGLAAFAAAIVALAGVSSVGIAAISLIVTGLASLIPMLAAQIVKGIEAFVTQLAKSAPKIATAMVSIGIGVIRSLSALLPQLLNLTLDFISQLLNSLREKLPEIISAGSEVLIGFLSGMRDNIGKVTTLSFEIITAYLDAVSARLPEIVESGWNLIISWIDAMRGGVEAHLPDLINSVRLLGIAIVKGLVSGIFGNREEAMAAIRDLGRSVIDGFKAMLGIQSPSSVFIELAKQIVLGLVSGIRDGISIAVNTVQELANKLVDALKGKYSNMLEAGKDLVRGFVLGLRAEITNVIETARELAVQVISTIQSVFDSHSPSRKLMEIGGDVSTGLALGIDKFSNVVKDSVSKVGGEVMNGFTDILSHVSDSINGDVDIHPTIRPVIDLTEVQAGSNKIDEMLMSKKTLNLATIKEKVPLVRTGKPEESQNQTGQPSSVSTPSVVFTQNNYSPKALDRVEIYRETRKQLLGAKGLEGIK